MRQLIVGNWKMFGLGPAVEEVSRLGDLLSGDGASGAEIVICPPATLIARVADVAASYGVAVGGQDCHAAPSGPHTGDISAEMLADAGAGYVIVGHSERRRDHGETDAVICAKVKAAWRAGLHPIICCGETAMERQAGQTSAVLQSQLAGSVPAQAERPFSIAYEPFWAVGTGLTPTALQIEEAHLMIAQRLPATTRILYGGSVNGANAREIRRIAGVGGVLVGGASLKATDFHAIIRAG